MELRELLLPIFKASLWNCYITYLTETPQQLRINRSKIQYNVEWKIYLIFGFVVFDYALETKIWVYCRHFDCPSLFTSKSSFINWRLLQQTCQGPERASKRMQMACIKCGFFPFVPSLIKQKRRACPLRREKKNLLDNTQTINTHWGLLLLSYYF